MPTTDQYRINYYLRNILTAKEEGNERVVALRSTMLEAYCQTNKLALPRVYLEMQEQNGKHTPTPVPFTQEVAPVRACVVCKVKLPESTRKDTKTCSIRCRMRLYRQKNSGQ